MEPVLVISSFLEGKHSQCSIQTNRKEKKETPPLWLSIFEIHPVKQNLFIPSSRDLQRKRLVIMKHGLVYDLLETGLPQ